MPTYHITSADGGVYEVEAADDAAAAQLETFINERVKGGDPQLLGATAPGNTKVIRPDTDKPQTVAPPKNAILDAAVAPSLQALSAQGLTAGLSDEVVGAGGALANMVSAPFSSSVNFDPIGAYRRSRDMERQRIEASRKEYPWLGFGIEAASGLASPVGTASKAAAGTGELLKEGAKLGAGLGAVSGFGYGEGTANSLTGAGIGATAGAALGAALPLAANVGGRAYGRIRDFMSPNSPIGGQLVTRALEQDRIAPAEAAAAIQDAHGRGVPLMMADLGDNLRGLAGSVSRKPGLSRTIAREAAITRQQGQGERIRGAIERDLGPIVNPFEQSDALVAKARAAAKPLYEQAYASPVVGTPELDAILKTPAGRGALMRARTIAANERRNPEELGFRLNEDGSVMLDPTMTMGANEAGDLTLSQSPAQVRGYSPQTLDYVKRGLDDLVEAHRDPVTRKLNLDEAGRAINDVRASLVSEVDKLNPDYAAARKAYQGPARERDALEMGRKALNASDQEIVRMTNHMQDSELDQFLLGYRSAMGEAVDRRVDGGDKAAALLGTPRKRAALDQAFNGKADLGTFGKSLENERAAYETYKAINTGSPTASRLADDAITDDVSLLEDATGRAIRGAANGGVMGVLAEWGKAGLDAYKFGAGKAGERARENAASLLFNPDPAALSVAISDAIKLQEANAARLGRVDRRSRYIGGMFGRGLGGVSAVGSRPAE